MKVTVEQLGLVAVIGIIAIIAALEGQWNTVGLALTGCFAALNLPTKGPSGPQS